MSKLINLLIILISFTLFGCAGTLPPPKRIDSQRGAIGIIVRTAPPVNIMGANTNDMVYFIRLENDEDLYNAEYCIPSNYKGGDQVYLLNAKPGRYSMVACYYKQSGTPYTSSHEYTTIFSKEIIELAQIFIPAGKMVFMGEFIIDQSMDINVDDEAQLHYVQLIVPGQSTDWLGGAFSGHSIYEGLPSGKIRNKQTEINFLTQALRDFEETEWVNLIQGSLDDLKSTKQ